MLKSMTGFGKAEKIWNNYRYVVELRSLNSNKGFDLSFKFPSQYKELEYQVRNLLSEKLVRGKIDFNFSLTPIHITELPINTDKLKSYYHSLRKTAEELNADYSQLFTTLLRMPEMLGTEETATLATDEKEAVIAAINAAIAQLDIFRKNEGKLLADDLLLRISKIRELRLLLIEQDKLRVAKIRERIHRNLENYIDKDKIDQNRFEQEIIYYIEKIDITEELTRLDVHCLHCAEVIASKEEAVGKKISFITQEMGREINTIGAKANDATLQKTVVQLKDELEKIKEQSNNIL